MIKEFENTYWLNNKQTLAFRHISAKALIENLPIKNFLDIGSGDGFFINLIHASTGINGEGFELSEQGIENSAKISVQASQIDILDTQAIEQFADKFELVTCLDVLEHMLEPEMALKNIHLITRKYLIISVPNFNSITARIQVLLGRIPENNTKKKGHCYWFNENVIKKILQESGFKILEIESNTLKFLNRIGIGKLLLRMFPGLFSLSFTVLCEKVQ